MDQKGLKVVAAIIGAGLVYEALALGFGWQLLSEGVWEISDRVSVFKFLAGVLCGHFFWPRSLKEKK